jgi:hypothetical protein
MKAKLIKIEDEQGVMYSLSGDNLPENYVLSDKNCQAIECGYDLDEEVSNIVKTIVPDDRGTDIWYGTSMAVGKLCFQKALSILGDKKYSEQDVRDAYFNGEKDSYTKGGQTKEMENQFIQSLQQNEWDVEILTHEEFIFDPSMGISQGHYLTKEILDSKGRLILKNI